MKKLSLLGVAFLAGSTLSAQSLIQVDQQVKLEKATEIKKVSINHRNVNRMAPIFEEDFEFGLAGNNGVGAWTTSGADANLWEHDFDGPNGDFSNTDEIVESPSVANGFMMFDTNKSNPGAGEGAPITDREGSLISPVIDLTGQGSVVISFYQAYRYCCSSAHLINLEVSTDGGATYPNVYQINEGVAANVDTRGKYIVNISSVAANQSNVKFRFSWGAGTASHYHWQIDDVVVEAAPENDLEMMAFECLLGDTVGGIQQNYSFGQEPSNLATSRWFMAVVKNNADTPKSAWLSLELNTGENLINVGDSNDVTVIPGGGAFDTLYIAYEPTMFDIAHYDVTATVNSLGVSLSADALPENNTGISKFTITEYILAANSGVWGGLRAHDNEFDINNDGTPEYMDVDYYNRWIQFDPINLVGMRTVFGDGSVDGVPFEFGIFGTDGSGIIDRSAEFYNSQYNVPDEETFIKGRGIDSSHNGQIKSYYFRDFNFDTFEFDDITVELPGDPTGVIYCANIYLPAGNDYAAILGAATGGGQGNRQMALETGPFGDGGAVATFLSPNINIIETIVEHPNNGVSVEENANRPEFYLSQNFPNPFNGSSMIVYQLNKEANNISFEVFDVTGKQVMSLNEGNKGAGQYTINIESSDFNTGLYYYSLTVNGQKITRKMVITE